MVKTIILWVVGILGTAILVILISLGQTLRDFLTIETIKISSDVYVITDYGGNSGLILGDTSALLIDTKMGRGSKKLKAIVEKTIGDRSLFVVNSHFHTDHVGGNSFFSGTPILAGHYSSSLWLSENKANSLPTKWVSSDTTLQLGNTVVDIMAIGANHTFADLFIYTSKDKVLFTGDVYCHLSHPVIRNSSLPDIDRWEETLREFAGNSHLSIDLVVPGHGDLAQKEDLLLMADYFYDIKTLSKGELKKKYRNWTKLPFLANIKESLKYMKKHYTGSVP